jgi:hypothetical protein
LSSVIFFRGDIPDKQAWQPPPFESDPEKRFGYIEEQIEEGEGFLSGQRVYKNFGHSLRLFNGIFADRTNSTLCSNFLKFNIRKFVEVLSEIREIGTFASDAKQYKSYAEMTNKVLKAIYTESQYPRALRQALQWASVGGIGYIWPKCKATEYGWGERRIIFEPLGLFDVLPVQMPKTNDVQDSYLITIYEYMPIAEAHGRFPAYQDELQPIDAVHVPSRLMARRLDWNARFRYGEMNRNWGNLYCEIRYQFIRDLRINDTGHEMPMGEPNTSWFYKVPYVGMDIFGGIRKGLPFMRPAKREDCRVYPQLRLMISSPSVKYPMYDGPAFDWDGQMPAIQYTVDDWPWESIGGSLIDAVGSIERTKRKHERQMDQVISTKLNPPLGYDRTSTGGPKIEHFNIFEQDARAGMDGKPKDVLQSVLPDEVRVEATDFQWNELMKNMEEQQLGMNDLTALVNMKMNISTDSFDKALESVGPIAKGIAATMEAGNAKVAYRMKFLIMQYLPTARVIEYIGADNVTPEQFDFDPDHIVPSHMADEMLPGGHLPFDVIEGMHIPRPSMYDRLERAKIFARGLRLISVPSTLLKITQLQEQTKILALYGRGFPIPPDYVAEKLGIEKWGEIPGDTLLQKWVNWRKIEIGLLAQSKALAAQLGLGDTGQPAGKQHAGGRPPSDQSAPKAKMKDKQSGAPRPIVSTSG